MCHFPERPYWDGWSNQLFIVSAAIEKAQDEYRFFSFADPIYKNEIINNSPAVTAGSQSGITAGFKHHRVVPKLSIAFFYFYQQTGCSNGIGQSCGNIVLWTKRATS